MRVTPIPHGLDLTATDLVRSPGVHMSELFGDLYADLEPKRFKHTTAPNPLLLALGTAWENHLEFLIGKSGLEVLRPGELMTDEGIAYSPDGIIMDDFRLAEYKYSSMGTKDLPTEPSTSLPQRFGKYLCQCMCYCYHLGTPKARLYFCSVNRPYDPELRVFDIEFTAQELQDNWSAVLNNARFKGLV